MATYSTDLITVSDGVGGTWGEFVSANTGGSPASDTENYIQGVECRSQTTGTKSGLKSVVFDYGSDIAGTLATDDVIFMWLYYAVGPNLQLYASDGYQIGIGADLTDVDLYTVGGADYGRNPYGGWFNGAVDPVRVQDNVYGAGNGGVFRWFGAVADTIAALSKGTPHAVDAIRYGRGVISVTGTGGSFTELAAYNDYNAGGTPPGSGSTNIDTGRHRLGLFQDNGGTFLWKGLMSLGVTATSVTFSESNTTILIDDAAKTYAAFNKLELHNASSVVTLENVTFIATGTVAPGDLEMIDNGTLTLTSCNFNDFGTSIFLSNGIIDGTNYNSCGLVTAGGASFDSVAFNTTTDAVTAVTAASPAEAALIQNSVFNSSGTKHGLEITGTAADMTLTDVDFVGYSTTVDADKAIFVNIATGTMEITISGGSGVTLDSHVRTAGAIVTVASAVPVTITVLDDTTGLPIASTARVALLNDTTKVELDSAAVNASGVYSYSYTGATPLAVSGWVREMSLTGTDYIQQNFSGEITSTGFSLTVRLVPITS